MGNDLYASVIDLVDGREVQVSQSGVHGDPCARFAAHTCCRLLEGDPSASQNPRPAAGCAVVAKGVSIATAPAGTFSQREWEAEAPE